ncbi:alpha-L-arabinofuranosidase C-terminal domain-containing protein [Flavihumibacter sp. CACIAM 22H1]|uniref:alpha-L-arabinofuranosidase C-terminal domain-containing protein n=1 Tax=Flavihumibacter sp. CACIAM 22H1 TaxID=1812911 RepID=UPI0007A7E738|nr:alpha-L-arabinofuranosidase C-terminal domain-containing protein [Flavihumibacter sp. CACIAM 22H1]KYP13917.1 MAG: alpha-L-arabinofuranosidase [Flavihumibacter sp. CACIAM 22H1]
MRKFICLAALLAVTGLQAQKQQALRIDLTAKGAQVSPTMWGVFFEDINLGADGGIYAELIKNRSFEFYQPLMGWKTLGNARKEGSFLVINRGLAAEKNPRFLRVQVNNAQAGDLGLENEGFRGMGLKENLAYDFSCNYRLDGKAVTLKLELLNEQDQVIGSSSLLLPASANWKKIESSLMSSATVQKGKIRIGIVGEGQLDLDMISLFPTDTWKGRKGGLRADMVQLLADLKPGFVRFPGGCIVEGHELSTRYQWKKTVGPLEERQVIINRWNTEFSHRPAPDYFQSFGLGFFEYFQLAEDIGAAPLPILNCGMACQFNTAELAPLEQLDEYIQDALDLIEFANGDASTQWGKLRVRMGHPAPFNLKYLGVGNENWGPQYVERLQLFTKALKAKHPEIELISSAGPFSSGELFDYLNKALRAMPADLIDEHYYRKPEWFFQNARRYDNYDRKGPKIFAGEYASHVEGNLEADKRNNWLAALSEAAFMTGLERNADIVRMASYAPLFAHVEGWQWNPDLIWVNNLQAVGSPSYYVQKLFSTNRGTHTVVAQLGGQPVAGKDSLYVSAVWDETSKELILKMVNAGPSAVKLPLQVNAKLQPGGTIEVATIQSASLTANNSLEHPDLISPVWSKLAIPKKGMNALLPPQSLVVWRIPVK